MIVRKISDIDIRDEKALDTAFEKIAPERIGCCNWPGEYPYAPEVSFRMFHTGAWLALRYDVREACTAALVAKDNGEVWTDSCVEFFIAPDTSGYYNFETSCIGQLLLGFRQSRTEAEHAPVEVLATVRRITSLPRETFAERQGDNRWSLTLLIPPQALFCHALTDWSGLRARVNLYKCGDNLSQPHFLSWRPIETATPDFHRPEFFENIECAEK